MATTIAQVSKLYFWCQKVLPAVFDDSLSYYEVLTKVVNKVNEVIDNVNEQKDILQAFIAEVEAQFSTLDEKISQQVVETINEMAEDGSLQEIIGDVFLSQFPLRTEISAVGYDGQYNSILNKPTIPSNIYSSVIVGNTEIPATASDSALVLQAGSNITLTPNVLTKSVQISSAGGGGGGSYIDGSGIHIDSDNSINHTNAITAATTQTLYPFTLDAQGHVNSYGEAIEIPAPQVQSNYTETDITAKSFIQNKPTLATVATSGSYNDLANTPALATVATSGSYNDLLNKPTSNKILFTPSLQGRSVAGTVSQFTNYDTYYMEIGNVLYVNVNFRAILSGAQGSISIPLSFLSNYNITEYSYGSLVNPTSSISLSSGYFCPLPQLTKTLSGEWLMTITAPVMIPQSGGTYSMVYSQYEASSISTTSLSYYRLSLYIPFS